MQKITDKIAAPLLPVRPPDAHKGTFGRVLVIAGSRTMCGAGLLCAKSALYAGAGLVYWALPAGMQPAFAAALPEAITLPLPETATGEIAASAWPVLKCFVTKFHPSLALIGPGMAGSPVLPKLLTQLELPLVLDADALHACATKKIFSFKQPVVLTPHPGEIAHLLGTPIPVEPEGRLSQVVLLAQKTGAVCVLKGHQTLVAVCEQNKTQIWQNTTGGPALAKGGSGDVLAGIIAGLWAQLGTRQGWSNKTALHAALCGVYTHGLAGDLAAKQSGGYGVLATQTAANVPAALNVISSKEK